jgi:hypothetical protein
MTVIEIRPYRNGWEVYESPESTARFLRSRHFSQTLVAMGAMRGLIALQKEFVRKSRMCVSIPIAQGCLISLLLEMRNWF